MSETSAVAAVARDAFSVGDEPPARVFGPISRTDIVRYQGASGDFNPIHHDELFARAAGFPTVFSVGMLAAGVLASYAADWFGPPNVRRFAVTFREQVWPGDVLVLSGRLVAVHDGEHDGEHTAGERRVEVALAATRQGGGTAATAEATFVVPGRASEE
jgi:acyl dehydratase